jgi:signal transduction histidine kinase
MADIVTESSHAADWARLRVLFGNVESDPTGHRAALVELADIARAVLECGYVAILLNAADGDPEEPVSAGSAEAVAGLGPLPDLVAPAAIAGRVVRTAGAPAGRTPVDDVLAVPVSVRSEPVGALLAVAPGADGSFDAESEHNARILASSVGYLVEHRRAAASFERQQRWLLESTELSREIVAGVHDQPLEVLAGRVLDVADADLVTVTRLSADGTEVVTTASAGADAAKARGRRYPRAETETTRLIDAAPEARAVDLREGPSATRGFAAQFGLGPALLVPLAGRNGVLAVMRHADRPAFSAVEAIMAGTFAAQMSLALDLAEARALRERRALLAERDRIARDLHDHVIQRLFAVGLTMQSLVAGAQGAQAERLVSGIDELDHTILQIRSTIYRLTGPVLSDTAALRPQIDLLVNDLQAVLGFEVDLAVTGPVDFAVDAAVGEDVIAVLRETLTNVARHSGATAARVRVSVSDAELAIRVADNGHGLGDTVRRSGLGNLRARAEQHDGSMAIETGPDGTTIDWRVPLRD